MCVKKVIHIKQIKSNLAIDNGNSHFVLYLPLYKNNKIIIDGTITISGVTNYGGYVQLANSGTTTTTTLLFSW